MRFHILTLFPRMVTEGLNTSILGRAKENGLIEISGVNIRDYTRDKHGKVDDYTYGGGAGMLMQAQPVYDAWEAVTKGKRIRTVYMTPQGNPFSQNMAKEFAKEEELVILCGHYEGIDERVLEEIVTDYVSIGDYVLTGGELPAMVMVDAISRLVPGVLNNENSSQTESFHNHLLEYPQYSRPEVWHDKEVPKVLLSGDHKKIEAWRLEASITKTMKVRPDLYGKYKEIQKIIRMLLKNKKENAYLIDCLKRDVADVVAISEKGVLGFHRDSKIYMLCADSVEDGLKLISFIPDDAAILVHNCKELNDYIGDKLGFHVYSECYQSVYTQKELLPIKHKDIRVITREDLPYVIANYGKGDQEVYLTERMEKKELFGAYSDGKLCGFSGIHQEGSLGILFVDPAYRRSAVGSSLACYLVNKALESGGIPYAHILTDNVAPLKMQEQMGLYLGKKTIFWTGK